MLLDEIYPYRPDDLIDEMVSALLLDGLDTVVAGFVEDRGLWTIDESNVESVSDHGLQTVPSAFRDIKGAVNLMGLCCVMHASTISERSLFANKVGIFKIKDKLSAFAVRDKKDAVVASGIDSVLPM